MERTRREQGGSKERARKEHGEDTERARESKGEQGKGKKEARREQGGSTERAWKGHKRPGEGQKKARSASKEPAGGGKNRLEGGGSAGWRGEVPIEVHEHKKTGALIGRRYVAR